MKELLTLKRKLQENPAAFTCDEKVFLKRLLTRDDELCNLRFISREMVNLLDTDDLTPAVLVHRVHTAVSALADVGAGHWDESDRLLYWDEPHKTLVDAEESGTVTIGNLHGTVCDILDTILSNH